MSASALNLSSALPDTVRELWSRLDLTFSRLLLVLKILIGVVAAVVLVGLIAGVMMTKQLGWLGLFPLLMAFFGGIVSIVAFMMYFRALNAGRQAVKVVSRYCEVGKPRVSLVADVGRFNTWLGVWQGLVVLGFLSNLVSFLPGDSRTAELSMTLKVVGLLISGGLAFAQWSAVESVKRFFTRFSQRAMGAGLPLQDTAARAATWMQIGVVLLWIGLVFTVLAVLGGILTTVLPSQIPGAHLRSYTGLLLFGLFAFWAVFGGLAVWVNFLLISLLGQMRQFMTVTAENADQRLAGTEGPVLSNTWMP